MRVRWNDLLHALVLVRIGQDLGHDTKVARMVHDVIDAFAAISSGFFCAAVSTIAFFGLAA